MARKPALQEIEATPEADRLEGFPHPRHTRAVIGHDATQHMLLERVRSNRLHHGWLITGPEGIGKATLAYAFTRHLLAKSAERDANATTLAVPETTVAYRQVTALSHPDLLLLRRPWDPKAKRHTASIPIDEVRRLRMFLGHKAEGDAWRVVLVDTADDLAAAAANALLKSLEEPPPRTVFILLSSEPGRLLPTIRSRCRLLNLAPLAPDDLKAAVGQALTASESGNPPSPGEWPRLIELSQGSVRRALNATSTGGLKIYERVLATVSALPKIDWAAVHTLSDEMAGAAAEQKFEQFYEFLMDLLSRLVRAQATGSGTPADLALACQLMSDGRLPAFAAAWSDIAATKSEAMALNLDRKGLIMDTVTRLATAASA
jgi:DNA polymerase III subunit delta'